ncbi:hypothetical protein B0H16DRAFT_1635668 [Mycena metata]|uniref:Protein kinase domain-containing protein n=1 Tax=Mycena metata TaxID=1033252 RepID=A0AAD7GUU6_9AGAR|nr:hypothetical protein B0H16DRAFT_1635668 [Mycena metata]
MSQFWCQTSITGSNPYSHYFAQARPPAPLDTCQGASLSEQSNSLDGDITTHLRALDFRTLSHRTNGGPRLDLPTVTRILSSTGPVITVAKASDWQWVDTPSAVREEAEAEQDYYTWLEWVVFRPAANAICAVRDVIYFEASLDVPLGQRGFSTTKSVYKIIPRGTADILHYLQSGPVFTAHEVKRAKVLAAGGDVLAYLVQRAEDEGGCAFRDLEDGLGEKVRRLVCQCIDELILYETTHIILATQENYVLLFLDTSHQFCVSRVYSILGSPTQVEDMAVLVLFYMHAVLNRRAPYPASRTPSSLSLRVIVPEFSPRLFQPQEALLRNGPLIHRAKLEALGQVAVKSITPIPIRFFADDAKYRPDGDVVVFFGRFIFSLFETHIVAKSAYQSWASERLLHEFAVYEFLRGLQGTVIPSLFGMYRNLDDGSSMLVTSYAGEALKDFQQLSVKDRPTLLLRVVRLHQAGVLHNDLEPRNIVLSKRLGPRIIDFDNATFNHACRGLSCKELSELAHRLGLDLGELDYNWMFATPIMYIIGTQLSRTELPQAAQSWLLIPSFCLLLFILYPIMF